MNKLPAAPAEFKSPQDLMLPPGGEGKEYPVTVQLTETQQAQKQTKSPGGEDGPPS